MSAINSVAKTIVLCYRKRGMEIRLYNTLTRKKEIFRPQDDREVKLYTCGPTVYDSPHIGNLRTYIFEDILRRVLEYNGYRVFHVQNITDVGHLVSDADEGEDKMMKALRREGLEPTPESLKKISQKYTEIFQKDIARLNILPPHKWIRATEAIDEMIQMIQAIERRGYAYETETAVYFDVTKLKDYTALSKQPLEEKRIGVREEVQIDPEKKHPADFALWFKLAGKNKNHVMHWPSPWGEGFPGWHIECSAMSTALLGESIDIHCGGVDHISVHHTNERAQNIAAFGHPVVRFWIHCEFLVLDKQKMSKSAGKFLTLSALVDEGVEPLAFRYFALNTHYRQKLHFSLENVFTAQRAVHRLYETMLEYGDPAEDGCDEYEKEFLSAMNNDLNTPKGLGVVWEMISDKRFSPAKKKSSLLKFDRVLGLGLGDIQPVDIPPEVQQLAQQRQEARKRKQWDEADRLREKIHQLGFIVEDIDDGYRIKKLHPKSL